MGNNKRDLQQEHIKLGIKYIHSIKLKNSTIINKNYKKNDNNN